MPESNQQERQFAPDVAVEQTAVGNAAVEAGEAVSDGGLQEELAEAPRGSHIVFTLGRQRYAAPIGLILELERMTPVTQIPNTPNFVLGVANLRGDVVSVLDLRRIFEMEPNQHPESGRMMKLRDSQKRYTSGFLVDSVQGLRALPPESIASAGESERPEAWAMAGVCNEKDEVFHILDVDKLFESELIQGLRLVSEA